MSRKRLSGPKQFGGMGFKSIHTHNLAMLGKQGWRFQTNEDSLATKLFKAKYYPKGHFHSASLGHRRSYA